MRVSLIFHRVRPLPTKLSQINLNISIHFSGNSTWLNCVGEYIVLYPVVTQLLINIFNQRDKDGCRIVLIPCWVVCCTVLLSVYGKTNHLWDKDSEVTPCIPFYTPTLATFPLALSTLKKISSYMKSITYYSPVERESTIFCPLAIVSLLITFSSNYSLRLLAMQNWSQMFLTL